MLFYGGAPAGLCNRAAAHKNNNSKQFWERNVVEQHTSASNRVPPPTDRFKLLDRARSIADGTPQAIARAVVEAETPAMFAVWPPSLTRIGQGRERKRVPFYREAMMSTGTQIASETHLQSRLNERQNAGSDSKPATISIKHRPRFRFEAGHRSDQRRASFRQ
ncbi:hypothetical protein ACWTU6_30155 [Mesorhizobium sp. BHbsci]